MKVFSLFLVLVLYTTLLGGVLLEDDFSDGNDDGWLKWTEGYASNASYEVAEGEYHLMNSGPGWIPAASHTGDLANGTMSSSDYSILVKVTPEACYRAGILARGFMPSFTGYILVMIPSENKLVLSKMMSTGPQTLDLTTVPLQYGQAYWLRLTLEGTSIQGKVWQGSVADEPSGWMVETVDGQYQNPGRIGAFCCNFSSDSKALTSVYYDDVLVTSDQGSLLAVSWAHIKVTVD
ncbi:hypothetical protein DRQ21_09655 [Candidatus Fermentibacteria bacterium]|jgi:hypothetical protein|nr:MAG: hypothetical protein DRQ21_09655 [Candidatus Fermentibacteria bacterium]